ncbi:MAG: sulfate adenylyltransferase subunit CysN [Gammaproteobacteria bacterium]|jgi:bifunctional enzyme CysN/CysC|nr:sulfate adenylyltransferase subunit CysN [Gammaproteobacteria bacterium]MCP4881991.1 sulfate adenylyltransferase subunit CysN [Gammaproteobacteria bacterium]MDP6164686.1 sulfate adenylyltransferase subunit CysN [Gammaproteobacteria bacterium]
MSHNMNTPTIDQFMQQQNDLDLLRFITCGSVDDGKSTLIGRLLYEAKCIFDDQVASLKQESITYGTQGGDIDFALLVDGLAAEREQGITIDVAYRFFNTDKRKFIVADTPGHEQYTRNMVTGASNADLSVILIDARKGVIEQTKRHAFICSLLGIKQVVLAINKMDLVDYQEDTFQGIRDDFEAFAKEFNFTNITAIPMSALKGDNVVSRSAAMTWFHGPTLMAMLETTPIPNLASDHGLRFPVQWVNRPHLDFRGFAGTIAAGTVQPGDEVRVLPSGATAKVDEIILFEQKLQQAQCGQAVTITLDKEIDASRGDMIVSAKDPCEVSDQFEVELVWMDDGQGFIGRSYGLQIGSSWVNAQITEIKYKTNINTMQQSPARTLHLNDIVVAKISLDKPVAYEAYQQCRPIGAFILVDRFSNATVAAGMIDFALRRAANVHHQDVSVNKNARNRLNGHKGKVLWFTGLSGSGKSTVANVVEQKLHQQGIRTYLLDGDNLRHGLNKDLGFTEADRIENIRRVTELAHLMVDAGLVVLTAFISPFEAERERARARFNEGEFIEVFMDTPLEVAEQRDVKGLYKKARRGEIPNFTGISSPYEAPQNPEYSLDTTDSTAEQLADRLLAQLEL